VQVITSLAADTPLRDVAERIRRIEALGFDTVHVSETVRDPFSVCALALEHSSTLIVRTSMVVAFARSPMVTAYAAWELANFSGGRFELGIATQVRGNIVGRFSMPWSEPVAQLGDYVASLRAIFGAFTDGAPLRHRGSHYSFSRLQPYFNPGPIDAVTPPIFLGGINHRMCELAGAVADGFVAHPTSSHPRVLREYVLPALAAGAARAHRDGHGPTVIVVPRVNSGSDEAAMVAARSALRSDLAFLYSTPAYQRTLAVFGLDDVGSRLSELVKAENWSKLPDVLGDDVVAQLVPQGTYPELPAVLASWYAGVCDGIAVDLPADTSYDDAIAAMVEGIKAIPTRGSGASLP
jgi:probable F420-dependent oxidoreductase